MYPVDARSAPVQVRFHAVPPNWKIATTLEKSPSGDFIAPNYDLLVDSPVEISAFEETDFDEGGAHYRIVVDADRGDYDLGKLVPVTKKIVVAENAMNKYRLLRHFLYRCY